MSVQKKIFFEKGIKKMKTKKTKSILAKTLTIVLTFAMFISMFLITNTLTTKATVPAHIAAQIPTGYEFVMMLQDFEDYDETFAGNSRAETGVVGEGGAPSGKPFKIPSGTGYNNLGFFKVADIPWGTIQAGEDYAVGLWTFPDSSILDFYMLLCDGAGTGNPVGEIRFPQTAAKWSIHYIEKTSSWSSGPLSTGDTSRADGITSVYFNVPGGSSSRPSYADEVFLMRKIQGEPDTGTTTTTTTTQGTTSATQPTTGSSNVPAHIAAQIPAGYEFVMMLQDFEDYDEVFAGNSKTQTGAVGEGGTPSGKPFKIPNSTGYNDLGKYKVAEFPAGTIKAGEDYAVGLWTFPDSSILDFYMLLCDDAGTGNPVGAVRFPQTAAKWSIHYIEKTSSWSSGPLSTGDTSRADGITSVYFNVPGGSSSRPSYADEVFLMRKIPVGGINEDVKAEQITATVASGTLTAKLQNPSTDKEYQFWALNKINADLVTNEKGEVVQSTVWVIDAAGYKDGPDPTAAFPEADANIDGTYTIMVRVKEKGGAFIDQFIKTLSPGEIVSDAVHIKKVTVNGKMVGNEITVMKGTANIVIEAKGGTTYNLTGETQNTDGIFNNVAFNTPGTVTMTASINSNAASKTFKVNVIDTDTSGYASISKLNAKGYLGGKVTFTVTGSDSSFKYKLLEARSRAPIANQAASANKTGNFTGLAPGWYTLIATASSKFDIDDIATKNVYVPRIGGAPREKSVTLKITPNSGTYLCEVDDFTGFDAPQFKFVREDGFGTKVVQNWGTSESWSWAPGIDGNYKITLMAREGGTGAGEEFDEKYINHNYTTHGQSGKAITFKDLAGTTLGNKDALPARIPVIATVGGVTLTETAGFEFKLVKIDSNAQVTESAYKAFNEIEFNTGKADNTFKIEVFMRPIGTAGVGNKVAELTCTTAP